MTDKGINTILLDRLDILKGLGEDYEKMHKFHKSMKYLIEIKRNHLNQKLQEVRDAENFYMEKFQELLKKNNKFDNSTNLSQHINYFLHTEIDEKIQNNQMAEESFILGKNLFHDINCVREKIEDKILLVNSKQLEISSREQNIEEKISLLTDDQKKIYLELLNVNKYDYATINNSSGNSGSNSLGNINNSNSNILNNQIKINEIGNSSFQNDNIEFNKSFNQSKYPYLNTKNAMQELLKNDKNNTNNLLGEIAIIFERLKGEKFFDKICVTENDSKYNFTPVKLEYANQARHLITDPMSMKKKHSFSSDKKFQNSNNTLKIIDKELNSKINLNDNTKMNSIFSLNSQKSSFSKNNNYKENNKINNIFENDYYEKEFSEDEFFQNNNNVAKSLEKSNNNFSNIKYNYSGEYFSMKEKGDKNFAENNFTKNKDKFIYNQEKIFNKFYKRNDDKLPNIPFILKYYSNLLIIPYEEKQYFSDEIDYQKSKLGGYLKSNYPLEYYESSNKVDSLLQRSSSNSNFLFNNFNSSCKNNKFKNILNNLEISNNVINKNYKNYNSKLSSYKSRELKSGGSSSENIRPRYKYNIENKMNNECNSTSINKINKDSQRKFLELSRISEKTSPNKKRKKKKKVTKSNSVANNLDVRKEYKEIDNLYIARENNSNGSQKIVNKKNKSFKKLSDFSKNNSNEKRIEEKKVELIVNEKNKTKFNMNYKNKQIKLEFNEPILAQSKNIDKLLENNKLNNFKIPDKKTSNSKINMKNRKEKSSKDNNSIKNLNNNEDFKPIDNLDNDNNAKSIINNENFNIMQNNLEELNISEINLIANTSVFNNENFKKTDFNVSSDTLITLHNYQNINKNNNHNYQNNINNSEGYKINNNHSNLKSNKSSFKKTILRNKSENLLRTKENLSLSMRTKKIESRKNIINSSCSPISNKKKKEKEDNIKNLKVEKDFIKLERSISENKIPFKNKDYFDRKAYGKNNLKKTMMLNENNHFNKQLKFSNVPVIFFNHYSYVKSRYEFLNKSKKHEQNEDFEFDPNNNNVELRINITPVNTKTEHFGFKSINKLKESSKRKKFFIDDEIDIKKDYSLIKSNLFVNDSRNKSLKSRLFISNLISK